VGPTAGLDDSGEERIACLLLQGFEPHTVKPEESHSTAYAINIKLHKYYTSCVTSKRIPPSTPEVHTHNDKKKTMTRLTLLFVKYGNEWVIGHKYATFWEMHAQCDSSNISGWLLRL
jgi:hypothetical protein